MAETIAYAGTIWPQSAEADQQQNHREQPRASFFTNGKQGEMPADLAGGLFGLPHGINFDMAAFSGHRSQTPGAQVLNEDTATRGREMNGHYLTAASVGNAVEFPAGPRGRIGTTEFSERYASYGGVCAADSELIPVQSKTQ